MTKARVKLTSVLLMCLLVASLLVGCFPAGQGQSNLGSLFKAKESNYLIKTDEKGKITDISLVSAIVDVINAKATAEEVYAAIPDKIKGTLSLHDFSLYTSGLSYSDQYQVSAFRRVKSSKKKEYTLAITTDMSSMALEASQTEFYELIYSQNKAKSSNRDQVYQAVIGIQHDEEGNSYLSSNWIAAINKIYEFSRLYFNALKDRDQGMLSWLLCQDQPEKISAQDKLIEDNKAGLLIDYYRLQVKTEPDDSIPVTFLPNNITYLQEVESTTGTEGYFRKCNFFQRRNLISVSDPYPEKIKNQHLNVYYKGEYLFSWSSNGIRQTYNNFNLSQILTDEPTIIKINILDPLGKGDSFWRIIYPELSFIIRGEASNENKTWSGIIERIDMNERSQAVSLGNARGEDKSIYCGMNLADFYRQYPFSPEADYVIRGDDQGQKMELVVEVGQDKVRSLILQAIYDSDK